MADLTNNLEMLSGLVERMKKNRESVPVEILNTKYKTSYERLKNQLTEVASDVFASLVFGGLALKEGEDHQPWKTKVDDLLREANRNGLPVTLGDALAQYCDLELFKAHAGLLRCQFEMRFYIPYWLEHTHKQKSGLYYNDIVRMWYDPEMDLWYDQDFNFGAYPPPEEPLYRRRISVDQERFTREVQARMVPERIVCCV